MVCSFIPYHRVTPTRKQNVETKKGERRKGDARGGEDDARWSLRARSLEIIIITTAWIINVDVCSIGA